MIEHTYRLYSRTMVMEITVMQDRVRGVCEAFDVKMLERTPELDSESELLPAA